MKAPLLTWKTRLAAAAALLALAACDTDGIRTIRDEAQAQALADDLGKPGFDLSRVVSARLTIDGSQSVEVTSLVPYKITLPIGQGILSVTLLRIDNKTDTLTLFTWDAASKVAFHTEVPLKTALENKKGISFPVATAGGPAARKSFVVERVLAK